MKYIDFKSEYNLSPLVHVDGNIFKNENEITDELFSNNKRRIVFECYPGIDYEMLEKHIIKNLNPNRIICIDKYSKSIEEIDQLFAPFLTDDRVFGKMSNLTVKDLYNQKDIDSVLNEVNNTELTVIYGFGASLVKDYDLLVYVDISRWEIQQRYRNQSIGNWKKDNYTEDILRKYKRGYFIEWRIADKLKTSLFDSIDYYVDGNKPSNPRMIDGNTLRNSLIKISKRPFRLVPYFDPGVWGGQWMKEVCNLDQNKDNYAWCFDCVPEENSIGISIHGHVIEIPAINVVLYQPLNLLGKDVFRRFGAEFPIRFDFLDTMEGQNLSLQVHPLKKYIKDHFGMEYTQDESYYILDSKKGSVVYLGVKNGIVPSDFIGALKEAQQTNYFDADKYVNKIPVKKHDHILIPAGTVHCSGEGTMVLEVSATPYIFTFKLWDWNRLGLDGLPRPIHIDHGSKVIQFNHDTNWVLNECVNQFEVINQEEGIIEERTGLHPLEPIETRRNWFTEKVLHHTNDTVNVLNLVEGKKAVVESPTNLFEPFVVNYAETFIVPASVGEYTISPIDNVDGKPLATLKAYVRKSR